MNVLFLTVDSLTYTRLGSGGAVPSPSPAMDSLMERSISFTRNFAAGCPTMFSLPAIFTSRLPLDDGGYGMGIRGRGTSFVEVLRAAGYETAGFSTGLYQGRLYGYDRGFDTYREFFDLGLYPKILRGLYLDYLTATRNRGLLDRAHAGSVLRDWLADFLPAVRTHCAEKREEVSRDGVRWSPLLHDRDHLEIEHFILEEERRFRANPVLYVDKLIEAGHQPGPLDGIATMTRGSALDPRTRAVEQLLVCHGLGDHQPATYPSSRYVLDELQQWIEARPESGRPWFAWTHLIDCHDLNFTSFDAAVPAGELEREVQDAASLRDELARVRGERLGTVEYDLSIRYVDAQIARLIQFLDRRGLREHTIIVLHSDHGGWRTGFPSRSGTSSYMSFFDEMYHVPLAISGPGIVPRQIDGLSSSLDVAPTILATLGLPVPADYRGDVATTDGWTGRSHVVMEHMGSGPCDFRTKPIFVTIRTNTAKAMTRFARMTAAPAGRLLAAYDLTGDPLEQNDGRSAVRGIAELTELAVERLRTIAGQVRAGPTDPHIAMDDELEIEEILAHLAVEGRAEVALAAIQDALADLALEATNNDSAGVDLDILLERLTVRQNADVAEWIEDSILAISRSRRVSAQETTFSTR